MGIDPRGGIPRAEDPPLLPSTPPLSPRHPSLTSMQTPKKGILRPILERTKLFYSLLMCMVDLREWRHNEMEKKIIGSSHRNEQLVMFLCMRFCHSS